MRAPNGYGSVAKLSGNRRNPFVVRKTKGWNEKGYPIYETIGYYPTRESGMIALAEYNRNPYDVEVNKITFEELYQKWTERAFPKMSKSSVGSMKSAYKHCKPVHTMKYKEIKSFHMQDCIDNCGCGYSTQWAIKNLFGHMDKFALEIDVINKSYAQLTTAESVPETSKDTGYSHQTPQPGQRIPIQLQWKENVTITVLHLLESDNDRPQHDPHAP